MTLESWLASLKPVTGVTDVQPSIHAGSKSNVENSVDVSDVTNECPSNALVTSETYAQKQPLPSKAAWLLACTSETFVTSENFDYEVQEIFHINPSDYLLVKPRPELEDLKFYQSWFVSCVNQGGAPLEALRTCERLLKRKREGGLNNRHIVPPTYHEQDRYCWPYSNAFNTHEIDISYVRRPFIREKLDDNETDRVIDLLIKRDRELLDMTYCFECIHLRGNGKGPWSCANAIQAEVDLKKTEVLVSRDWPYQLQRCPGFKPMLT